MTYLKPRNPHGIGGYPKGVSGNPKGRPVSSLGPLYRTRLDEIDPETGKSKLLTLFDVFYERAKQKKDINAFNALLNRAFGRAVETKDINLNESIEHKVYNQLVVITEEIKGEGSKELEVLPEDRAALPEIPEDSPETEQ